LSDIGGEIGKTIVSGAQTLISCAFTGIWALTKGAGSTLFSTRKRAVVTSAVAFGLGAAAGYYYINRERKARKQIALRDEADVPTAHLVMQLRRSGLTEPENPVADAGVPAVMPPRPRRRIKRSIAHAAAAEARVALGNTVDNAANRLATRKLVVDFFKRRNVR
jgi:hypothetical protein